MGGTRGVRGGRDEGVRGGWDKGCERWAGYVM